jgi:hypothetical protein
MREENSSGRIINVTKVDAKAVASNQECRKSVQVSGGEAHPARKGGTYSDTDSANPCSRAHLASHGLNSAED